MDTGASSHMASDSGILSSVFNLCSNSPNFLIIGNGSTLPITSFGHTMLANTPYHLSNTLVALNIVKNLIYVSQFSRDNNYSIEFDPFGFSVKDLLTRTVTLRCNTSGDLYPVMAHSSSLWHLPVRAISSQSGCYPLFPPGSFLFSLASTPRPPWRSCP